MGDLTPQSSSFEPHLDDTSDLPPIPEKVRTPDGQDVDLTGEVWEFRRRLGAGVTLSFRSAEILDSLATPRAIHLAQLYVVHCMASLKPRSVGNLVRDLRGFARFWSALHPEEILAWKDVTFEDFHAYLQFGLTQPDQGNPFSRVRQFYGWGAFVLEVPDFDKSVALELKSLTARGNKKGEATVSWDPLKGPLTDDEVLLLIRALDARGGTSEERIVLMILLELGLRPAEIAMIEGKHLRKHEVKVVGPDGHPKVSRYHHLEVPKEKDRAGQPLSWKLRPVSDRLGGELERAGFQPEERLSPEVAAKDSEGANKLLKSFVKAAKIVSPRTGKALKLNSRRLRYTLATRLAAEGASRVQIAEILGHTDLQNVEVYIKAARQEMDEIDEALENSEYKPVISRFMGRIGRRSDPEPVPGVPKRIVPGATAQLPVLSQPIGSVGVCGRDVRSDGLCKLAPPLSCYLCDKFVAFVDAPHGEIADRLEEMVLFGHNSGAVQGLASGDGYENEADRRIPRQLIDTLKAIRELEAQIQIHREGSP